MRTDCVYCVSGKALRFICDNKFKLEFKKYEFPILLNHIKKFGKIFYEMKSEDKSFLIDFFRKIPNKITCMIGNGQNDIDAIMTAHVGININPPINYNTMLCHFNPIDGSLFCIEKIIRYGRVIYENIYLLGVSNLLSSLIIIFYILVLFINKIDISETDLDFLSCLVFALSILAFVAKPDLTINSSPLFNNPFLCKVFFMLIVISFIIITLGYGFLFMHLFSRNEEYEIEMQDKLFQTYSQSLTYSQLVSIFISLNSINFYRTSNKNNFFFWGFIIIMIITLTFIYCICGYSFHPLNFLSFEYSSKNVDTFDDKNKLVCFLLYIANGLTYYFFVCILLAIFNKIAQNEKNKMEKK
jgi:magnesium-transporting ATPase (P-type)